MKIPFFFFFSGIFLTPFYFFSSGGVQIADLFFILSFLAFIGNSKSHLMIKEIKRYKILTYLSTFTIWCSLVNLSYYLLWNDNNTILAALYYIYNFLLLALTLTYYKFNRSLFLKQFYYVVFLSLLLVFTLAILNLDYLFSAKDLYRRTVTFNNPNQLGYWALLVLTLILLLFKLINDRIRFKNLIILLSITMSFYLTMISLSKAAIVSIFLLILFFTFKRLKVLLPIFFIFYFVFYLVEAKEDNFIGKYLSRINTIGKASDDSLKGRNYDRIWKYPEYLLLGAGEGAIEERFNQDNEIHSTFGTIIFSYGLVGFLLFSIFLYKCYIKDRSAFVVLILPITAYGLSHMGLRAKLFWITLGLFVLYINAKDLPKDKKWFKKIN